MPGIGAGAAFLGSIPQMVEARRLRKERERLLKEGPPGLTPIEQEQMAAARAEAASSLAPGYAPEMEGIAEQQSNVLGAAKKAGLTGSNIMNTLSRLNQQGQAARRNLAMRGAQAQRAAKGDYRNLSMNADAKRQGRVREFEGDVRDMQAKIGEYNASAAMSPLKGALAFMPAQGIQFGEKKKPPTIEDIKFNPEKDVQMDDEMNVSGVRMAPAKLIPDPNMTGLGSQFNMAEDIGYDPYTSPPRASVSKYYPVTQTKYADKFGPMSLFNPYKSFVNAPGNYQDGLTPVRPGDYPDYMRRQRMKQKTMLPGRALDVRTYNTDPYTFE
jgi:hypothetical protein